MPYEDRTYMRHVNVISSHDLETLKRKDAEYGGSWLKRGGIGAFMMLARKWDRIEEQSKRAGYDVIMAALDAPEKDGLLDDIADLRIYLMLVEAEILEKMEVKERCPNHPNDTCYSKSHGYYCRKCGWHRSWNTSITVVEKGTLVVGQRVSGAGIADETVITDPNSAHFSKHEQEEIVVGVDGKNPPQVPRFNVTEQEHPFGYDPDQDG